MRELRKYHVLIDDGAKRYLERRKLPDFIEGVKQAKNASGFSWEEFSRSLGLGKNVVGDWIRGNKKPLQYSQLNISKKLNIPYEEFLFKQNYKGEYPCGLRIADLCKMQVRIPCL